MISQESGISPESSRDLEEGIAQLTEALQRDFLDMGFVEGHFMGYLV